MGGGDMTLNELAKMRLMRAKPAFPIVLTDDQGVRMFCVENDLPFIWTPNIANDADLRPLYGLPVWVIPGYADKDATKELRELITQHKPLSMWVTGPYGFEHRIRQAIGRSIWN